MKKIPQITFLILLSTPLIFGQCNQKNENVISNLKKKVDRSWIIENPTFEKNKPSYFTKENQTEFYIGLLQISGSSIPFVWDCNFKFLDYLLSRKYDFSILRDKNVDNILEGTKIQWKNELYGLIWFNDEIYKTKVDNWYLAEQEQTECPGTITFPELSFFKVKELPNAMTNNIQGLVIFPFTENLKINPFENSLKTKRGKVISGISYDLNNDGISDLFSFEQEIDETTYYIRLYLNINGNWECKWIYYKEFCL